METRNRFFFPDKASLYVVFTFLSPECLLQQPPWLHLDRAASFTLAHAPSNSFYLTHSLNIQQWGATPPINSPSPLFILVLYSRLAESSRAPSHLSCGRGREAEPMLDFCGFSLWSGWFIFLLPPQSSPHLAEFLARPLKLYFCRSYSAALVWLMSNTHRGTERLGALAQNEDGAWDIFSLIYVGLCAQHHHNGMKLNLRT